VHSSVNLGSDDSPFERDHRGPLVGGLFVVDVELSRVFHGYEPRLQSRVVPPTCLQRQISENPSKDPLPRLFRDPPTENAWHFEGDYTSDQMKSMIRTNH
jgi:hypothetical protein